MKLFGIAMVRNEADVIRLSILHHLALGLDRILIVDNGSSDGTTEILERLHRDDPRIEWWSEPGSYQQELIRTELAREAFRRGADWVVPFDADEFWWVRRGDLRTKLAGSAAGALRADVVNFVQRRDQLESSEAGLLTMTRRPAHPIDAHQSRFEAGRIAYIEMRYPPKWIFRPTAEVVVGRGNHNVAAVAGSKIQGIGLSVLHAPLRSRAGLARKSDHGKRVFEAGSKPDESWHFKHWARLETEGALGQEWRANSYDGESLDVYGVARRLVVDYRLVEAVKPFLEPADDPAATESASPSQRASLGRTVRRRGVRAGSVSGPRTELESTANETAVRVNVVSDDLR
jgi:hypothetical protein